jgi:hypothetical protein
MARFSSALDSARESWRFGLINAHQLPRLPVQPERVALMIADTLRCRSSILHVCSNEAKLRR